MMRSRINAVDLTPLESRDESHISPSAQARSSLPTA